MSKTKKQDSIDIPTTDCDKKQTRFFITNNKLINLGKFSHQ